MFGIVSSSAPSSCTCHDKSIPLNSADRKYNFCSFLIQFISKHLHTAYRYSDLVSVQLHLVSYFHYRIAHNTHGTIFISMPRKSISQITVHVMTTTHPRKLIFGLCSIAFFYIFKFCILFV